MSPISSQTMFVLGILSSWQMLLFWASLYIFIYGFRDRRWMKPVLRNPLLLSLCFVNYTLFQCTVGYSSQNAVTETMIHIVERYSELPVLLIIGICTILTLLEICLIRSMHRWYHTHITSASIKETIETLPVGVCAFEPSGKVILRNKSMEQLCRSLMGMPLLNGNEFLQLLTQKKSDLTELVVSLPDFGVWSFEKDEIEHSRTCFTLLIAHNVTKVYQKTQMLAKRQETVSELNRKLLSYNKQIEQVITQQEILNAKVQIHDELGTGLLAIKRYLVSGGSIKEREDLMERLKGNIRFLQQEVVADRQDEYFVILSTAKDLGVTVLIDGTLPQDEPNKHIIATAIHECFTNILRHTKGDTLYVTITEETHAITAQFTDNNPEPVGAIAKTGGLRSLHDITLQAHGRMQITTSQGYCLTITLPKETKDDVL